MNASKLATNAPIAVFVLACLGFAGWLVYDSLRPPKSRSEREQPQQPSGMQGGPGPMGPSGPMPSMGPGMPGMGPGMMIPWSKLPVTQNAEKYLDLIQLNMPRLAVERHLAPMIAYVGPVDMRSGSPTLVLRYRGEITRHVPQLMPDIGPDDFVPGVYNIRLEFDGTAEDHPLRNVRIYPARMP